MHPQQVQNFAQHSDAFASSCWEPPLILTYHIAAAVQIPKLQIATAEGMARSECHQHSFVRQKLRLLSLADCYISHKITCHDVTPAGCVMAKLTFVIVALQWPLHVSTSGGDASMCAAYACTYHERTC